MTAFRLPLVSLLVFLPALTTRADNDAKPKMARSEEGYIIRGNERTAEQVDKAYAQMPPVKYEPPADRWRRLPRTARLLRDGPALRVVMLGDSIVNDTSRSGWDLVLQRHDPNSRIEKVTSVRGSTGCWWYKENGRVRTFVLDHRPDLVVIGGISQRDDTDSIREVIRQIRAASPDVEFLLMSGAFGPTDPRDDKQWAETFDPAGNDYRARLKRLADETPGCAFLDMAAAWGRYVRDSGKDLEWFKRDPIHANERGEQILGRVLARYLAQDDVPSPRQ